MRSAYLVRPNRIEVRDVPIPSPQRGELLIRIKAALTCGTDKKAFLRGHPMIPMPGPFGHEFSGIVAGVGEGCSQFREGDEIMAVHSAPCGNCWYCTKGLFNHCEGLMHEKVLGAFAEYLTLPAQVVRQNTFIKPKHLTFQEAAMLEPLACVVHGIAGLGLKKDDRAIVIGNGPIALLHCLVLVQLGLYVVLTGRNSEKIAIGRQFGAQETILLSEAINANINADVVFECTGAVDVWELAPSLVRKGGKVVLFGGCKLGTRASFDTYSLHYHEVNLIGAFHFTPKDVREAYGLLCEGLPVKELISGTYDLSEIVEVFHMLKEGKGLKYTLIP